MHMIGVWPGTIYDDFCFPQKVATFGDTELRTAVVSYLKSAEIYERVRGFDSCMYSCGIGLLGAHLWTDGNWIWPESLLHYVEDHHVSLPDAFIATIHGDAPPPPNAPAASLDIWRTWCASHRSESSQALVTELKQQCEAESELRLAEEYDRITAGQGTADVKCMWQACQRRALKGIVYCAHHYYNDTCDGEYGSVTYPLRLKYTRLFLSSLRS